MKDIVVHVHRDDHDRVRDYYAARGATVTLVHNQLQRWFPEPAIAPDYDRYAELDR